MLDPRPPLADADADTEPDEVGVGASVWMENICSDDEDCAMITDNHHALCILDQVIEQLSPSFDAPRKTYLA